MNQYLIDMIKSGRNAAGLTQAQVAEMLGIKGNTLSGYENGVSEPDIDTYLKLCKIYNLDYVSILEEAYDMKPNSNEYSLSKNEQEHIKKYRTLDRHGKKAVDHILDDEYTRVVEQSLQIEESPAPYLYTKTEYLTGLSAGTGLFVFDDIPTQVINVPEKYKDADFVIGVSGNSMQPTYCDGDKVAVKKSPCIDRGEIGVFMIDGNGYIKELGDDKLISHNKAFSDIELTDSTICIGKVLGKL